MSKVTKYKDHILNFITSKSCFADIIDKKFLTEFIKSEYWCFPVALMAVFGTQSKKNSTKSFHTLHAASSLVLMVMIVMLDEKKKYYEELYGADFIKKIKDRITIFTYEAISQNIKTMENTVGGDVSKIQKKIFSILYDKLLLLTEDNIKTNNLKIKRSDIIKYKFSDKNIIDDKYRHLKRIEKNDLIDYISNKYCSIGQCAFLFGWLFAIKTENKKNNNDNKKNSDNQKNNDSQKILDNISKIGSSFGILVKLIYDFCNLENDIGITNSNEASYNFIVNYGIHESFRLYDENKVKFIEGCITNELYSSSIKELIEKIDKLYDKCLKNTDLELDSQYSSFISDKKK